MAILQRFEQKEMPFPQALARGKTGDIIAISSAPKGIVDGVRFAHKEGVLSVIDGNVFLNNTFVCSNDVRETHGTFFPFYAEVLIYQKRIEAGKMTVHEFYRMRPSDPVSSSKNTIIVPKPAFSFEADELEVIPLSSGKGLILIESKPNKRILLLKRFNFLGATLKRISAKNVPVAWEGPHALCVATPSSVIVGAATSTVGGTPLIRYFRGHGRNRTSVHDHPGVKALEIWATDVDFFYDGTIDGDKFIISATTGKPMYPIKDDPKEETFPTSTALIRRIGPVVYANGRLIADSLVTDWALPHAQGILYGQQGEIRLLVIHEKVL